MTNNYQKALKEYLGVTTMAQAKRWIGKQPCGPSKKDIFLNECDMAMNLGGDNYKDEEAIKDYFDGLRRDFYG